MEKPSCLWSHWWQAPVYFSVAAMLAFLAITTAFHASNSSDSAASVEHISPHLSHNASQKLRSTGFGIFATMMQLSPELFVSPSSNCSTVFAVRDSAIHSLGPLILRDLLRYHTLPANLSVNQLMIKPENTCFETLLSFKNVSITRKISNKGLIEINHVPVSYPNLILEDCVTVHGVTSPFVPPDQLKDSSSIPNQGCNQIQSKHVGIQWTKMLQSLRLKGFTAFAAGLQSVHPILIKDLSNLTSVTIFMPPDLGSAAAPERALVDIIKVHVLPRRLTYQELNSLHDGTFLKTLDSSQELTVAGGGNASQSFRVGGVEITAPNVIRARDFVVHGVARAFEIAELHHSS